LHRSARLSFPAASSILVLGLAVIAAGCGGGAAPASTGDSASTGDPGTSATPTTTAAPGSESPSAALEDTLVVYSGRSEELVAPIIERFEEQSGVDVEVRYAGTSEHAATILEEGANSPADVFFSQDGGALGALGQAGVLAPLPQDLLEQVDERFRADAGNWVGVTGRARVLAYDTRELTEAELPGSVQDLADPEWKGRIGWVPTNASFQTFVTALRATLGDEATVAWLKDVAANEPRVYDGNAAALEAVRAGEIDAALINHYYLLQAQREAGEDYPVANHFFANGDPGALVNVAGVGILETADHPAAAEAFARFLLDETAQTYFATETFEYPLRDGIAADERLPALSEVQSPGLDLSELDDLPGTLRLLQEAGVL
jgi:iron(III) transport system substrate-binding protein